MITKEINLAIVIPVIYHFSTFVLVWRRWEDNIKMDIQEVGCGCMEWIELSQDKNRWRALCDCGNESSGSIEYGEFLD